MFTKLFIRGALPAILALAFLNSVPTQVNAGSML
jgi:hypothetical protein